MFVPHNLKIKNKNVVVFQNLAAAGGLGGIRPGFTTAGLAGLPGATGLSLQQASALASQAAYNGALPAA